MERDMALQRPQGVEGLAAVRPADEALLSHDALAFLASLHRAFDARRQQLLAQRKTRQAMLDAGNLPDFAADTRAIRDADWQIAPLPPVLLDRRVEITGPVERKAMINALNAGASAFMADFEDATSPGWGNIMAGHHNVCDAWAGTLSHPGPDGQPYRL